MAGSYRWQNRIRFVDTDASQRIHYTAMFRHFEAAEQEFLRDMGCPYSSPAFREYSFPRVHVECDFTAEIRYDDAIEVELTVDRVGTSSFTLIFHVTVEGRAVAKGKITVVSIDRQTQKPCRIPDRLAEVLRAHLV
ncbi:MAG: acyl-CoA thioesterase [Bryobacterales bacterium]|nr:acyl-CoA thioesterase [Bryobacterales bacterium]